jgi:glycosyltransferase involved in cell wall biosynthesis
MLSYTTLVGKNIVTIGLDATPLTVPTGGVARYTLELARALTIHFPEHEYWLLSDQPFPAVDLPGLHTSMGPRTLPERKWWLWGVQQEMTRRRVDLFHGTDFSVPYLPLRPSVMTLHDLSPWLDRRWQPDASRIRRRTAILLRTGIPTMVITPSEAVRRGAIDRFHLSADRVVAVPLAASEQFRPVDQAPPATPYFLFVGTIEPRKNVAALIEAWREVRKSHAVDLVIAGRTRSDASPIAQESGLRLAGAVPDRELPGLYSGALAVVYPSLYEGFGLPVLEAMQCGAVVIASRDPAIMEVAGDGALLIDATDGKAMSATLCAVAEQPEKFAGLRDRARRRAAEFSWQRTAQLTTEVYETARRIFRQ